jgi:hypothetical protein
VRGSEKFIKEQKISAADEGEKFLGAVYMELEPINHKMLSC